MFLQKKEGPPGGAGSIKGGRFDKGKLGWGEKGWRWGKDGAKVVKKSRGEESVYRGKRVT